VIFYVHIYIFSDKHYDNLNCNRIHLLLIQGISQPVRCTSKGGLGCSDEYEILVQNSSYFKQYINKCYSFVTADIQPLMTPTVPFMMQLSNVASSTNTSDTSFHVSE
jgi:hypothetical protein